MSVLEENDIEDWSKIVSEMDNDTKKMLRGTLSDGMYFRRERQWKVFTWSSSIFTVLITGLLIKGTDAVFSNIVSPTILTVAATFLLLVADDRIRQDKEQVRLRADLIAEIDRSISVWIGDLEKKYSPKEFYLGNRSILWGFYLLLISTVWLGIFF